MGFVYANLSFYGDFLFNLITLKWAGLGICEFLL